MYLSEQEKEDQSRLDQLNTVINRYQEAYKQAVEVKKEWLRENWHKYAKAQIGEELYDFKTGRVLGVVTKYYGNSLLYPEYEFKTGSNTYSNTTSQMLVRVGNKENYIKYRKEELERLTGND
jgi:DNA repair exonuclease SbcCD ATPase subunit